MLKNVYADKTKMKEKTTSSNLKWTVVRPGRLFIKEAKNQTELKKYIGLSEK